MPLRARRGSVLLIVLVVIAILALGAYTFAEFMVLEARATSLHGQTLQARALADSGVEYVAAQASNRASLTPDSIYNNASLYHGVSVGGGTQTRFQGSFSVVAPLSTDITSQRIRYGLVDESAKLNVNTLLKLKLDEVGARQLLLGLPNMTEDVADAILDWIDEDDDMREFGAEGLEYQSLTVPYTPRNGPIDGLEELLLVRGVTAQLLFGEDANRNGLLDPGENDGSASLPLDNQDGRLDRGWSAYLTTFSRESNKRQDGAEKLYINNNILADLYDQIQEDVDEDTAKFIIAMRLSGPVETATGTGTSSSGGTGMGAGSTRSGNQQIQQLASGVARAVTGGGAQGTVTRGGMNLTGGAKYTFTSLYDLIGAKVQIQMDGTNQTLESPWTDEPGAMVQYLPVLMDLFTTVETEYVEGRVNINQAPFEVIFGLPGMTEELASQIVAAQEYADDGSSQADQISERSTTGWLVTQGLVDLATMKELDPYVTARGDVFRIQVVGYFVKSGPAARVEAVIDATQAPPAILFVRDLTELGRGYSAALLGD